VRRGAIGRSYGIYVARLAGVPEEVVENAKVILGSIGRKAKSVPAIQREVPVQGNLFPVTNSGPVQDGHADALKEIREADLERMTPIEALNLLHKIREKI